MSDVIETVAISDTWVSGCARIENAGGECLRFYFYARQGDDKILVCKIVCPVSHVMEMTEMKQRFFASQGAVVENEAVAAHH